jgi:hypothetical protein
MIMMQTGLDHNQSDVWGNLERNTNFITGGPIVWHTVAVKPGVRRLGEKFGNMLER